MPVAVEHGSFWVFEATGPPPRYSPQPDTGFTELGPADLDQLEAAMQRSEPETIRTRFESGRRCFGFDDGGRIVSFGWVTFGPEITGELERELAVPAGEAYVWDCGTIPERRMQGLYTALLNRILHHLEGEGVPRVWIGASRLNEPSVRGIDHAGFRHVLDLTYRRWLALTLFALRPAPDASPRTVAMAESILLKPGERRFGRFVFGWLP